MFFFFALFCTLRTPHHTHHIVQNKLTHLLINWNLLINTILHQVSCFQLLRIFVHFSEIFSFFFHFHINRDTKIFSIFYSSTILFLFYSTLLFYYPPLYSVPFYFLFSFSTISSKYIITYVRCRKIMFVKQPINFFRWLAESFTIDI